MTTTFGITISTKTRDVDFFKIMSEGYGKDKNIPEFNYINCSAGLYSYKKYYYCNFIYSEFY
jgi:hypothetical protein